MRPSFGEASRGAMAGAVIGAIGGLFAVGIAPAIIHGDPARLFGTPRLGLICWVISWLVGWIIGGQIGPRIGNRFNSPRAEVTAGAVGGLVPVVLIALWSWYMVTRVS